MRQDRTVGRAALTVVCMLLSGALLFTMVGSLPQTAKTGDVPLLLGKRVLIDAGHGGFDGGAAAPDGTQEKDINLALSRDLADMMRLFGYAVSETRVTDRALAGDDGTIRSRKTEDMYARLALYEQSDLTVSIHQNKFGAAGYHGAQVFYSTNHPQSQVLAESIRQSIVRDLEPENTRALKAGDRDIFLLYRTTRPAVLVECGFLSNPAECRDLKSETFRKHLALAIACGTVRFAA